ncbi:hypothetical protein GDO81_027508 [Engystomops pustulosus]|uniref:Pleiotrophin n=1 Tax=Engystomops pustulosus TaxID=76066 RepID=A0AAV6YJT0_ENGPU|nr:hypothetical protein GDO81_027508 [Engystomops pustulosus]
MHHHHGIFTLVLLAILLVLTVFATDPVKKDKQEKKVKKSDCGEWQWSVCVATTGDCGIGTREGTRTGKECKQTMKTQKCKIPCNWKKQFGGERVNNAFIFWGHILLYT